MSRITSRLLALAGLLALIAPSAVFAQGVLIDVRPDHRWRMPRPIIRPRPLPPTSYKIKEIAVNATVNDQVAKVQVSQTFVNTGSRQMEVCFVFPLPYDGAVDQLTLMVDGKEYEAKLLDAKKARSIYEEIVRRNQDPALMEWIGTGMFKTSVFPVPAGASRTVTLRYTQLLRKHRGLTDFLFPLSTAKYTSKAVEKVALNVVIQSEAKIKNVYSPTHSVEIKRPANSQAIVKWEKTNEVPMSDFRLFFDVGDKSVGASVLSYRPEKNEDGYFLLLVSPEIKRSGDEVPRKTVIVVIDRSGSMSGKKIEQARGAVKFVINNLRQGDLFNVIAYDSTVESFKPELQKFDDETRKQALGFAEGIYAGGATNIDGALKAALSQLKDKKQPSYVIFLTDGLPTAGETKETQIVVNASERNEVRARVFTFGVGYDVNSRLLDKLARECFGQSEYVRPAEDIEESVSRMYSRVGSPVMTDTSLTWDLEGLTPEQGSATNRVYPREIYDLFAGEQLVLVGRYKMPGAAKVTVTGKVNENSQKLDFPAKLIEQSGDETYAFVERLWAMRRVGEIIDEIDLKGKNQELIDELIGLATKHGILTPYTSFLADDDPTGARPRPTPELARRQAGLALDALESGSGKRGFDLRKNKADYKAAAKAPAGPPVVYDAEEGQAVVVDTVKYVGKKTFYRRGARWIDSTLNEKDVREAVKIERYGPEYFELITKFGKDVAKYLAIEGNVTIKLGETTYTF